MGACIWIATELTTNLKLQRLTIIIDQIWTWNRNLDGLDQFVVQIAERDIARRVDESCAVQRRHHNVAALEKLIV